MPPNDFRTLPPGDETPPPGSAPPTPSAPPTEPTLSSDSLADPTPANIRPLGTPLPSPFGRYRIVRQLGRGGMGTVYLAEDTQLGDRPVALKVPLIHPDEQSDYWQRFHREARAAAKLHHPNICAVYDVGAIDGILFLAMAYIEGPSLAQRIRNGPPLTTAEAVRLVRTLALALDEAHQRGIVHRDLKPSNVILDARGEPVVMDFGLAWVDQGDASRLTQTGQILGTPAYMPPEQVKGDTQQMGPRSDIYSLGVMLYELLTGKLPFAGHSASVLARVLTEAPPPPSSHRPDLDPGLEAICLKAMAKKPADRFASMKEFAAALANHLHEPARESRPSATLVESPRPPAKRGRPLLRLAVQTFVFLLVATLAGLGWHFRAELMALLPPPQQAQTSSAVAPTPTRPATEPIRPFVPPKKLPPVGAGLLHVLGGHSERVSALAFSPDNRTLLSGSGDKASQAGSVRLWDLKEGREISRLDRVSGQWVPLKGVERVGFSAGGSWAYCVTWDVAIWLFDVQGLQPPRQAVGARQAMIPDAALLPDGSFLLYAEPAAGSHDLRLVELYRPERIGGLLGKAGSVACLAISPDGRRAAIGRTDGSVALWDVALRKLIREHEPVPGTILAVSFSSDGQRLLAASRSGEVRAWDAGTGKFLFQQRGPVSGVWRLAFSADGRWVVASVLPGAGQPDHLVVVWEAATGKVRQQFKGHRSTVWAVALSADGRLAASGGEDKVIHVWRLE